MDLGKKGEGAERDSVEKDEVPEQGSEALSVVLVGHPRVGKAALLEGLLGGEPFQKSFSEAGLSCSAGHFLTRSGVQLEITDLPGVLSLASRAPEAELARDLFLGHLEGVQPPDLVLATISSEFLDRQLALVLQLVELALPVWVLVKQEGELLVEPERLSEELGVPVLSFRDESAESLEKIQVSLDPPFPEASIEPRFPERRLEIVWKKLQEQAAPSKVSPEQAYWLLADAGYRTSEKSPLPLAAKVVARDLIADLVEAGASPELKLDKRRRERGHRIAKRVLYSKQKSSWRSALDRELLHHFRGPCYWLVFLFLFFCGLFSISDSLGNGLLSGIIAFIEWVGLGESSGGESSSYLQKVITGVGAVVCFLPFVALWLLFWSLLESCGVLARLARLLEPSLRSSGLQSTIVLRSITGFAKVFFWKDDEFYSASVQEKRAHNFTHPFLAFALRLPVFALIVPVIVPGVFAQAACLLWLLLMSFATSWLFANLLNRDESDELSASVESLEELSPLCAPDLGFVFGKLLRNLGRCLVLLMTIVCVGSLIVSGFTAQDERSSEQPSWKMPVLAWQNNGSVAIASSTVSPLLLNVHFGAQKNLMNSVDDLRAQIETNFSRPQWLGVLIFLMFSVPLIPGLWSLRRACGSWRFAAAQWCGFLILAVVMAMLSQSLAVIFS